MNLMRDTFLVSFNLKCMRPFIELALDKRSCFQLNRNKNEREREREINVTVIRILKSISLSDRSMLRASKQARPLDQNEPHAFILNSLSLSFLQSFGLNK